MAKNIEKEIKRLKKLQDKENKKIKIPKPQKIKPQEGELPKWYNPLARKELKKELIQKYITEYSKPIKSKDLNFTPSKDDIKEYLQVLKKTKLKDLLLMGDMKQYKLKLDLLDRLKSIDKKKFAVVTIFNDNRTTDTGVCHCYSRTFSRNKMSYIVMSERGIYDPEFKMLHFYYYANNPFPILFQKNSNDAIVDAKLLDDTIEMKVIEALASVDIDKKINIILMFLAITMIVSVLSLILQAKASGIIGG